jgi:glycosyltransferase involved in cell wall biosynthesis
MQPERKHVWLFIDIATSFGGHEVMLLRWIEELRLASARKPILVCCSDSRLAAMARDICEVETVMPVGSGGSKLSTASFIFRLLRVVYRLKRKHSPELVVVAEGGLLAQRHGLFVARLLRLCTVLYVPLVASFSAMQIENAADLERRVRSFYGKLPHAWLTITHEQSVEFRSWAGVRQPIFLLPNTVSRQVETAAGTLLPRASVAAKKLRVLVLGRMDRHQKGLDLLLQFLQASPHLAEYLVVSLIGEGPYRGTIDAALKADEGLRQVLVVQSWEDPLKAMSEHDVLLMTSRFEGVPLVMLEAMCVGIPVIATDLSGTREYLDEFCRYPVGDIHIAFDRLLQLRQIESLRHEIAARNLETFKARASGEAFKGAVRELTEQLHSLVQHRA